MTTIETTDQAHALPVGAVIRTARGPVAERGRDHRDGAWYVAGYFGHHPLKDTDLPAVVLHDPTQPAPACDHEALVRMIVRTSEQTGASAATLIRAAEAMLPAPAGVIDREALADHLASVRWDNAATRMDRRQFWRERADAVLAVLHTRTVAQVKAEALREYAAIFEWAVDDEDYAALRQGLIARADYLEREDKRG